MFTVIFFVCAHAVLPCEQAVWLGSPLNWRCWEPCDSCRGSRTVRGADVYYYHGLGVMSGDISSVLARRLSTVSCSAKLADTFVPVEMPMVYCPLRTSDCSVSVKASFMSIRKHREPGLVLLGNAARQILNRGDNALKTNILLAGRH